MQNRVSCISKDTYDTGDWKKKERRALLSYVFKCQKCFLQQYNKINHFPSGFER